MPSIKANVLYSALMTVSGYASTLLVFPYVSRVLGAANIGLVYYVESIVHYFLLFAALGVNSVGTREIAAVVNDEEKRNGVFSSILSIHVMLSLALLFFYLVMACYGLFPNADIRLLMIGAVVITVTPFTVEWFYKGVEAFRYITLRTVFVRCLFVVAVYLLVSDVDDAPLYYALLAGSICLNASINFIHSRKYVRFTCERIKFSYIKPYATLGVFMLMISLYTTFNTAYLGAVKGTEEVGYYTTAVKIYTLVMAIYASFTSVMLPRMSALASAGRKDVFDSMVYKSLNLLFTLCIPLICFSTYFAKDIINIIAGNDFNGAVFPMRLIMGLIIAVGISQIVALQVFVPLKKEKLSTACVSIAACVGVIAAFILVPRYGAVGSAMVLVASELIGTALFVFFAIKQNVINFPVQLMFKHLVCGIIYFLITAILGALVDNVYVCLVSSLILIAIAFIFLNCFFLKNSLIIEEVNMMRKLVVFRGNKHI